jgi:hypothetical protein
MCKNPILLKFLFLTGWNHLQNIFWFTDFRGFWRLIKIRKEYFIKKFDLSVKNDNICYGDFLAFLSRSTLVSLSTINR